VIERRRALDELRRRARAGELTPDDLHAIIGHIQRGNPDRVRSVAIAVAGDYLAMQTDAALTVELIQIAESNDTADDCVRTEAIRALAKATDYKGQRVHFDL
jgi:hypothetical protein